VGVGNEGRGVYDILGQKRFNLRGNWGKKEKMGNDQEV